MKDKLPLNFYFFLVNSVINTLVTYTLRFGVAWYYLERSSSLIGFASIFAFTSFFEIYSRPLLSPIADYFNRGKVYHVCQVVASIATCILLLVVVYTSSAIILTILLTVVSLASGLRSTAASGLLPRIVSLSDLVKAQSVRSSVMSVAGMVASVTAGFLVASGGATVALFITVVLSALAMVTSRFIKLSYADRQSASEGWNQYFRTWGLQVSDGLRALVHTKPEFANAIALAITNFGLYPFFIVVVPIWVQRDLSSSAHALGIIEFCFALGIFAGGGWLTKILNNNWGKFGALVGCNLVLGLVLILISLTANLTIISSLLVLGGVSFVTININTSTLRAAATPDEYVSRMIAAASFISACGNPFALQGYGYLIEKSSSPVAIALSGGLIALASIFLARNKELKNLLSLDTTAIAGIYAERYPSGYRTLSTPLA